MHLGRLGLHILDADLKVHVRLLRVNPAYIIKKIEQIAVHKNGNGLRALFIRNHLGLGSIRV